MNRIYTIVTLISAAIVSSFGCKKDPSLSANYTSAKFNVDIRCDDDAVLPDSFMNTNASGNLYNVHKLNYYISNVQLINNENVYKSANVFYIDPFHPSKKSFILDSIPVGNYTEIELTLGLEPEKNRSYTLVPDMDNTNMLWPEIMGGGYHFLKMEGLFRDVSGATHGYAIHLGRNENKVRIHINGHVNQCQKGHDYSLQMNINEVFKCPHTYDLNIENNYTMSDSLAMKKIKDNINDAFTIIQSN